MNAVTARNWCQKAEHDLKIGAVVTLKNPPWERARPLI